MTIPEGFIQKKNITHKHVYGNFYAKLPTNIEKGEIFIDTQQGKLIIRGDDDIRYDFDAKVGASTVLIYLQENIGVWGYNFMGFYYPCKLIIFGTAKATKKPYTLSLRGTSLGFGATTTYLDILKSTDSDHIEDFQLEVELVPFDAQSWLVKIVGKINYENAGEVRVDVFELKEGFGNNLYLEWTEGMGQGPNIRICRVQTGNTKYDEKYEQ